MEVIEERLEALFTKTPTATTEELCEALFIKGHANSKVRSIHNRAKKAGYPLEHIGYNTWVKAS